MEEAGTGGEILVKAVAGVYAAIILNLCHREMSGLSMLELIRPMPCCRRIPVVTPSCVRRRGAGEVGCGGGRCTVLV